MTPLVVADLMAAFESAMVLAALSTMISQYGDPVMVGWMVTGYLLVSAAGAAIIGRLGDMFGRKRVLLLVMAVAVAGSVVSAAASSLWAVIAGRAVQGFAVVVLPLCFGLMREHLPSSRIPTCIGVITATSSIGSAIGLIGGGMIIDSFDWRSIFIASSMFGAVAIAVAGALLPPSEGITAHGSIDWLGGVLFAPAIAALLFAASSGGDWGWTHPAILPTGIGGTLLLAFWARRELRCQHPLIDLRLFTDRNVSIAYVCLFLAALGSMQVLQFFMLFAQQPTWTGTGLGLSATAAGVLKLPAMVVTVIGAPISGWAIGRLGGRPVIIAGLVLCSVSWLGMLVRPSGIYWTASMLASCALGIGIVYTVIPNMIVAAAPPDRTSEATGLLTVVRALVAAIGAQLMMILLGTSTVGATPDVGRYPSAAAYSLTLLVLFALSVTAALAAWSLPSRMTNRYTV